MHADHTTLQIVGHALVAFLFLYRGVTAMPEFNQHLERMLERKIPLARVFLAAGFATMIIGGLMVLFDFYTLYGASLLILFTLLANFIYHDFWTMTEPRARQTHLWIFCNNIAVMGGLVLVIAS